MKAVLATIVLLSSSLSFALSNEEAAQALVLSCAIEKFCAPGTATPVDGYFTSMKAEASTTLGGADCAQIDALLTSPEMTTALKDIATSITSAGQTTCLSTIQ